MNIRTACLSLAIVLLLVTIVSGQGFINLDFEQATIAPTPVGGWTYPANPAQCFPGWTVSSGVVMYNDLSLGSPCAVLMGPDFPNFPNYTPLQGSYSVLLQYFGIAGPPPSLSQTAVVPANAQSISILVPAGQNSLYPAAMVVTLNGINIPLVPIAGGRVAGNISGFAGNEAQLTISTVNSEDWIYFDDIQFSSSSVPEPSTLGLFGICIISLCWWMKRSNKSLQATPTNAAVFRCAVTPAACAALAPAPLGNVLGTACLSSGR